MNRVESPALPEDEPMHMALCEVHSLVLRPGQLYAFSKVDDCEKCAELHQQAVRAYEGVIDSFPERDAKHVTTLEIERLRAQIKRAHEAISAMQKEFRDLDLPYGSKAYALANEVRLELEGWKK